MSGPRRRIAWRVLDAQYFGVAQRRKRVFLVASGRAGFDPTEVLFESDSLHGHPAPGEQSWPVTASYSAIGADGASNVGRSLTGTSCKVTATFCFGGGNTSGPIEKAACLTARGHKCDFEVETFAAQSFCGPLSHTLNTANGGKGSSEDSTGRGVPIVTYPDFGLSFAQNSRGEVRLESGHDRIAGALSTGGGKPGQGLPMIASVAIRGRVHGATAELGDGVSPTLRASNGGGDKGHVVMPAFEAHFQYIPTSPHAASVPDWSTWRVRRLMPVECERLQGMPDNWTLVPYRGKPAADAPRYKAIGNSMAVPCVSWLGSRLQQYIT